METTLLLCILAVTSDKDELFAPTIVLPPHALPAVTLPAARTTHPSFKFPFNNDDDAVVMASGELISGDVETLEDRGARDGDRTTVFATEQNEDKGSGRYVIEKSTEGAITEKAVTKGRLVTGPCEQFHLCYSDDDCGGRTCMGAFVGTCNCNACQDNWLCESDGTCGGLTGACNKTTNTCDCFAGFEAAGFLNYVDVHRGLCNRKKCTDEDHEKQCFGLPCHYGKCEC